jgi:hypothetical protein
MRTTTFISIFVLLFGLLLVSGCKTPEKRVQPKFVQFEVDMVLPPVGTTGLMPSEVNAVLKEVEDRNKSVEDDPEWIGRAYGGLLVRRLTNVSEREYHKYQKYLDEGAVYVLVHPGFFSFFHYPRKLRSNTATESSEFNIVEMLIKRRPKTAEFALLQAQERRMRDFIEFKSTQKKLLIVIVPRNYRNYSGYTYRKGKDEYMRFLNEITNLSDSVLFVESRSPNRGYLTDEDAIRLVEFFLSINVKRIYVGGSYVGRCLEDFYTLLTKEYGNEGIYMVPELSDLSPREVNGDIALGLLKSDGSIDKDVARRYMKTDKYSVQETIPHIMSLP